MGKAVVQLLLFSVALSLCNPVSSQLKHRKIKDFDSGWKFYYADTIDHSDRYKSAGFNDSSWRELSLPHDWSIEGAFKQEYPASPEGGALPGGVGWYRKTFRVPRDLESKTITVEFDGVYQNSEVWINEHFLGLRPNGYISFQYDLTPYLHDGGENVLAVKVDNSKQPNSRWYSGSGIYRNVRLVAVNKIAVAHWGTFVRTSDVTDQRATVTEEISLQNATATSAIVQVRSILFDPAGKVITQKEREVMLDAGKSQINEEFLVAHPQLWAVKNPTLYKVLTQVSVHGQIVDDYETSFGIRYFNFDADKGFFLNGKAMKILGVCEHHDLGALGSAVNRKALERQLQMLKRMGVNAIRTSHNPPAPELLELTDQMGFIVMDEAFDVWRKGKKKFDYHLYFDEWHRRDLEDQVKRDRNHPSVLIWSIGNEISEQTDTSAFRIARELAAIIHALDTTRPITAANNNPDIRNQIIQSGALDLTGYNYHHKDYPKFHDRYPGKLFLGTETTSALETRGFYDMPSDSIRRWPPRMRIEGKNVKGKMNEDFTVSAYDNISAPWGSTHEESWKVIKKYDFLSGMFIWTGFDYLGEPTPYSWPARSSYFGIIDLAGFPKDVYYMYQSEWTDTPVLHVFPHWNWPAGKLVDVWVYYNQADEVELFLNGISLGVKRKQGDDLHLMWRVTYVAGTLKAVSTKNGKIVLTEQIKTAGRPAKIELSCDRKTMAADGKDMSFITARIVDDEGNLVPDANNLIQFKIVGKAYIAGVDNGDPTSHEPFKANSRKALNGMALAMLQSTNAGKVTFCATSDGLKPASITIQIKK